MTPASERRVQNEIRNALAFGGLFFRANVGRAWVGDAERLDAATVLIRNARPFDTGLPNGFSDLFGIAPVVIDERHIGQTFGRFVAIEVKSAGGRVGDHQRRFLEAVTREGGLAGVARSVEDAARIVAGN